MYRELAHAIMEAEKGDPRKLVGVIQTKPQGLRTREAYGLNSSLRARKMSPLKQAGRKQNGQIPPSSFCSSQVLNGWMMPTYIGEDSLSPLAETLISFRNSLTNTP